MAKTTSLAATPVNEDEIRQLGIDASGLIIHNNSNEVVDDSQVRILKDTIDILLQTAEFPNMSAAHRATACVALCGVFERCQVAKAEHLRNVIWDERAWSRLFGIYMNLFDKAKAKSMRQVLVVSTALLLNDNSLYSLELRDEAVLEAVTLISKYQNHRKVKPALQALAHFISKDLISVDQLLGIYSGTILNSGDPKPRAKLCQMLLAKFLDWALHHDTALSAGHLVAHFLAKAWKGQALKEVHQADLPLWVEPLETSIRTSPESIQEFRHHIFPEIFRLSFGDYLLFLFHVRLYHYLGEPLHTIAPNTEKRDIRPDDSVEISMLLTALQVGKDIGMVKDVDYATHKAVEVCEGALLVPDVIFGNFMAHSIPEVRLAAISLLVSSTSVTRPITKGTFQCIQGNLFHLHADTDANFRSELLSQLQRLFDRLRSSTATLNKALAGNAAALKSLTTSSPAGKNESETNKNELEKTLKYHIDFISWYISFLSSELRPTASYQRHVTALKSLNMVMKSGLDPIVSYSSLSKQAQGDKRWHHQRKVLTSELVRSLLDLLLDPFDEVHSVAAAILRFKYERNEPKPQDQDGRLPAQNDLSILPLHSTEQPQTKSWDLLKFVERAEKIMLRTGRADHADGVARAYELLYSQGDDATNIKFNVGSQGQQWWLSKYAIIHHLTEKLEKTLDIAHQNLSIAVNQYPVHGIFASIRFIIERSTFYLDLEDAPQNVLEAWKTLHLRLYKSFDAVWICVRDILCNDAPEGHVPDDLEEDSQITTKDILSYSWRALKEASILLRAIIARAPFGKDSSHLILNGSVVESLGKFCFNQLIQLRHRGAFTAVAQTFAVCCQRCCKVKDDATQKLLVKWYQDTMLFIRNKFPIITRRSAGIPSLITAIISADSESPLFTRVMEELFVEASLGLDVSKFDESRVPQVHALNCIKDIFTTTRLALSSEAYLSQGLDLAATKLGSELWPIRNCGLMLFKALIERLLGTGETQHWNEKKSTRVSRLSYSTFPNLLDIVVNLITLQEPINDEAKLPNAFDHGMEAVFPALQILQKAPPPSFRRDEIQLLVLELTRVRHWYIRDMAARTYVSDLCSRDYLDGVHTLLAQISNGGHALHGKLLCLKYALKVHFTTASAQSSSDRLDFVLEEVLSSFRSIYEVNPNPLIRSAYIDVLNEFSKALLLPQGRSAQFLMLEKIAEQLQGEFWSGMNDLLRRSHLSVVAGAALLRKSISLYLIYQQLTTWEGLPTPTEGPHDIHSIFENMLRDLSVLDLDTYCIVLEELVEVVGRAPSELLRISKPQIVACIHHISLEAKDPEVKATSYTAMACLLSDSATRSSFFNWISLETTSETILHLENGSVYGPPMECEASLLLHGYFLDHKTEIVSDWDTRLLRDIERYTRIISMALNELNPFTIRFAAVRSLASLQHMWTTPKSAPLLHLALLVYDALNDDDDEIRELSTGIAMRVVMGPRNTVENRAVVPLLASRQLCEHFQSIYADSSILSEEALRRFMACDVRSAPLAMPFANAFAEARQENSALFAQEKQNLFIDTTRDIETWARVLEHITADAITSSLAAKFEIWVIEGIEVLTATTAAEIDGPLGWGSKSEVFTLRLRVVYGARVLLEWARRDLRRVGRSTDIRLLLQKWVNVGNERELSGIWMEQLEQALGLGKQVEAW